MRYCVMCGMPLPHRPLTTPGAQSTLNFTRIPVESSGSIVFEQARGVAGPSATGVLEPSSGNGRTPTSEPLTLPTAPVAPESPQAQMQIEQAPPTELVPDVSLDEYIQKFRYEPPTDPGEVTMLGEAPPLVEAEVPGAPSEQAAASHDGMPANSMDESNYLPAGSIAVNNIRREPEVVPEAILSDSVANRLGLEPETAAEERIQRPRFLDVNEPSKESQPMASSGTSTIVGPSFLGLSDPPQTEEEESSWAPEEDAPSTSHWRGWLATAVVVIFAVLGVMEWRSQASPTDHGILQVISAKLQSLRHSSTAPANNDQSSTTSDGSDPNSKPDMQAEQPQPAKPVDSQNSSTTPPPTASATGAPSTTAAQPSAATPPPQSPVSNSTPKPTAESSPKTPPTPAESTTKNPSASTSQPGKPSAAVANSDTTAAVHKPASDQAATPKPSALGADEMARAKNASDPAATAAWLWKATAKGNPDAPVQLADLYIKGEGVPRSCEQAMVLLKTAAEKENARARNRLAAMYATGNCVNRNRVEAYRWVSSALAANPSSQWAQQNRDLLWQQMTPEERAAAAKYR
jgi:outer membrane biosynthesis protein TonB